MLKGFNLIDHVQARFGFKKYMQLYFAATVMADKQYNTKIRDYYARTQ
jgi:hypothetical protein